MASNAPLHIVTGAFGYTGRYIAKNLLSRGLRVRTLTNSVHRDNPFGDAVEVHPIDFDDPAGLTESMRDGFALYNTYWVRYDYRRKKRDFGYDRAIANTRTLFDCAARAGVGRVVHVSVANASAASEWGYFQGKARLEADLRESGLAFSIVRPTVIFGGPENVLINNIAWLLRRFPVFGLFGRGNYRLTPVHVNDVAQICVDAAFGDPNTSLDAVGPETFTYRQMIHEMTQAMGLRRLMVPLPDFVTLLVGRALGVFLKDIVITGHEISGLRDELMYTGSAPLGTTSFVDWLQTAAPTLGRQYSNDLIRRR